MFDKFSQFIADFKARKWGSALVDAGAILTVAGTFLVPTFGDHRAFGSVAEHHETYAGKSSTALLDDLQGVVDAANGILSKIDWSKVVAIVTALVKLIGS